MRERFKRSVIVTFNCQRPYHIEHTSSRPITEVKQCWVQSVLGWVTAWEHWMLLASLFCLFCSFFHYFGTLGRGGYLWTCQTYYLWRDFFTLKNFYSLGTLNCPTLNSFKELFGLFDAKHSNVKINGEVSQSLRYCNTRPTRETSVASNWPGLPWQKSD